MTSLRPVMWASAYVQMPTSRANAKNWCFQVILPLVAKADFVVPYVPNLGLVPEQQEKKDLKKKIIEIGRLKGKERGARPSLAGFDSESNRHDYNI